MANFPVKQITKAHRLMGGVSLFQPEGSDSWIKIGAHGTANFTPNVTNDPVYSAERGYRQLIKNVVTLKEATLEIADIKSWGEFLYQVLAVSKKVDLVQTAQPSGLFTVDTVKVGGVYFIPGRKGAVSAITDGEATPISYVEDTHFTFHSESGAIEILAIPVGAGAGIVVEYTLPAITSADEILTFNLMSESGLRGAYRYIGYTSEGNGTAIDMFLPDVEFLPNGGMAIGDVENANAASVTASVYATDAYGYGTITMLDKIVFQ